MSGACLGPRPGPAPIGFEVPLRLRIGLAGGAVRTVAIEEYVRGTILSEVAPAAGGPALVERMLQVQAIVARTYAVAHQGRHARDGFDLCATTHCQLYEPARIRTSRWSVTAANAVATTRGMVLWFGGSPAATLFHADCGGYTSGARDVWGGTSHPYLRAAADAGPAAGAHRQWRFDVERGRLIAALNADPRTRVGLTLAGISVLRRDQAGRAEVLELAGARRSSVRGEELRAVLTAAFGAQAIKSTKFTVAEHGSRVVFVGHGFGHGVGLCQAGALARLDAGARPEQVLTHYYPGTTLAQSPITNP